MKYICDQCNYETDDKNRYARHMVSKTHKLKYVCDQDISQTDNIENELTNFICQYCPKTFNRKYNLNRHQQNCNNRQHSKNNISDQDNIILDEIKKLRTELFELKDKINNDKTAMIQGDNNKNNSVYNISVNNHVKKTFPDAPALLALDDYSVIEKDDDDLIDSLVYKYLNNGIDEYLGNIIIKYYKKDDPMQQSIWNSDVRRLSYVIKELIANKETVWCNDPQGVRTKKHIIEPLLKYIKNYVSDYVTHVIDKVKDMDTYNQIKITERLNTIMRIKKDISDGKLANDIIKFIAPEFYMDNKYKLLTHD